MFPFHLTTALFLSPVNPESDLGSLKSFLWNDGPQLCELGWGKAKAAAYFKTSSTWCKQK